MEFVSERLEVASNRTNVQYAWRLRVLPRTRLARAVERRSVLLADLAAREMRLGNAAFVDSGESLL